MNWYFISETIRSPKFLASAENAFSMKNLLRIQPKAIWSADQVSSRIISVHTQPMVNELYASPPPFFRRIRIFALQFIIEPFKWLQSVILDFIGISLYCLPYEVGLQSLCTGFVQKRGDSLQIRG